MKKVRVQIQWTVDPAFFNLGEALGYLGRFGEDDDKADVDVLRLEMIQTIATETPTEVAPGK